MVQGTQAQSWQGSLCTEVRPCSVLSTPEHLEQAVRLLSFSTISQEPFPSCI